MSLVIEIARVLCRIPRRIAFAGCLAPLLANGPTQSPVAQTDRSHAMRTENQLPPDQLPAPKRMSGIGNSHIKITAKPEAQIWFDQGLNLIDDFWDYESARAFEQSIRVDPQCAMCYWGLHRAESFYHGTSQAYAGPALAKAMALRTHASKQERLYIEATTASESLSKAGKFGDARSERVRLLRKLVKRYPKDTQARIALANALEDGFDDKGEPRSGQRQALALLEAVLKDDPNNSAANHYYIHALEAGAHPERALHSAELLPTLAPNSGHMVHMPGHIYYRVGDYGRAQQVFESSMQVDEQYLKDQHVRPDDDWNYVHNLMYSVANLLEEGKFKEAIALSEKLNGARGQLDSTLYSFSARDSISRIDPRLPVFLRTADWTGVLDVLAGIHSSGRPHLDFLARELIHFAAGMNAIDKKDISQAGESSARFDAELWRMSQQMKDTEKAAPGGTSEAPGREPKIQLMPDAMLHPLLNFLSVMSLELRAGLATAEKQTDEAQKLFAQAREEEKGLGYREPPVYIRPVAETEAAALIGEGDWAGAKAAYERALLQRPRSGFALYGIAMCNEKLGDTALAARGYAEFLAAWKHADAGLAEVTHAQSFIAAHPLPTRAAG